MAEETKKISFGFSKLKKQNNLVKPVEIEKPKTIEYVDSFDGVKGKFSYKGNVRSDEPVKKELVIPLIGTRTVLEVIASKLELNSRNKDGKDEENGSENAKGSNESQDAKAGKSDKREEAKDDANGKEPLSIDDLAAKEILNDLKIQASEEKASNEMVIKQPAKTLEEKEIPIDYENIPVNDFGLAMLRGMGWTPKTGIGKDQRVVPVVTPKLRPKGLGLGADKVMLKEPVQDSELAISIKSYVKFISGLHSGSYGQVESMDEDNGRVIVKLALGGTVSASEMLLRPVAKKDYDKNSKVINSNRYSDYGEKPEAKVEKSRESRASDSRRTHDKDNGHRKEKYAREESRSERSRRSREDENESDERRKKRMSSSSSSSSSASSSSSTEERRKHGESGSRDRKHKKSKKKKRKKKKKGRSSGDSDGSNDRKRSRERSKPRSRKSKSKNSSHR